MLFFRRAKHFIAKTNPGGTLPTIEFDAKSLAKPSDAWLEWREYFERHVGQVPMIMRKMIEDAPDAIKKMTVPAEFPVLFDNSFRPMPGWRPAPPRVITPKEHRETVKQLEQRFGSDWGIKMMKEVAKKRVIWSPPTEDDLRRIYGRRHDDAGH